MPLALVVVSAIASVVAGLALQGLERRSLDARLSLRRDGGWPNDLVLVPIDDPTLNRAGRWPWPREQIGKFLESVKRYGAKTMVVDLVIGAPSTPASDAALARSIAATKPVLTIAFSGPQTTTPGAALRRVMVASSSKPATTIGADHTVVPMEAFARAAGGVGHAVFFPDPRDGQVRGHSPFLAVAGEDGALPSTALVAFLAQHDHGPADVALSPDALALPTGRTLRLYGGALPLDFVPHGSAPHLLSAQRILEADAGDAGAAMEARAALGGKLALVYVDSAYSPDLFSTPLAPRTSGGLLIASAIRTLDGGRMPRGVPLFPVLGVLAILALGGSIPLSRRTPAFILGTAAATIALYAIVAVALVPIRDLFLPVATPVFFLLASAGAITAWSGHVLEQERVQMRQLLDSVKRAYASDGGGDRATVRKTKEIATRIGARVEPVPMSKPTDPRAAGARPPDTGSRDAELGVGTETRRGSNPATTRSGAEALVGRELDEPVQIGQYEVQRELGRGGMGAIFLAIDRDLDRPVAIKILESATKETFVRFRREAMAVARISHPNVVQIYEVGLDSTVPFIVMEYVAGGTLSDLLRDPDVPTPLPWDRAARIVAGVARGLGAAHVKGIVHRDMKPANVLMVSRRNEFPKIADFGIAKLSGADQLTREGLVVGTVGYLSPEQALGKPVDPRSDVYSLAVMFYRMITGHRVFEGTTEEMLRASVTRGIPDPREVNPDLPSPLAELLVRMGALERDARPKDGNVVAAALDMLLSQAAGPSTAPPSIVRPAP